jgi:hypothetical protein
MSRRLSFPSLNGLKMFHGVLFHGFLAFVRKRSFFARFRAVFVVFFAFVLRGLARGLRFKAVFSVFTAHWRSL